MTPPRQPLPPPPPPLPPLLPSGFRPTPAPSPKGSRSLLTHAPASASAASSSAPPTRDRKCMDFYEDKMTRATWNVSHAPTQVWGRSKSEGRKFEVEPAQRGDQIRATVKFEEKKASAPSTRERHRASRSRRHRCHRSSRVASGLTPGSKPEEALDPLPTRPPASALAASSSAPTTRNPRCWSSTKIR